MDGSDKWLGLAATEARGPCLLLTERVYIPYSWWDGRVTEGGPAVLEDEVRPGWCKEVHPKERLRDSHVLNHVQRQSHTHGQLHPFSALHSCTLARGPHQRCLSQQGSLGKTSGLNQMLVNAAAFITPQVLTFIWRGTQNLAYWHAFSTARLQRSSRPPRSAQEDPARGGSDGRGAGGTQVLDHWSQQTTGAPPPQKSKNHVCWAGVFPTAK